MKKTSRKNSKEELDYRIKSCRKCKGLNVTGLTESCPGYGNINSPIMIIGQSLCTDCMYSQIPFTGGSGVILDSVFKKLGLSKKDLFITNIVHCHPYKNRASKPIEISNCFPYLMKEIKIVNPLLIIGLGKDVKDNLMPSAVFNVGLKYVNGRWEGRTMLFVYHPAYFLRRTGVVGKETQKYIEFLVYKMGRYV